LVFIFLFGFCGREIFGQSESSLVLNSKINLKVTWTFPDKDNVVFEVEGRTPGYLGFGFSETGGMTDSDLFMAGVDAAGNKYIKSRYGLAPYDNGHWCPTPAAKNHWTLIDATEKDGVTNVKVSRPLDPNNDNSYKLGIRSDNVTMIWAYQTTDFTDDCDSYHGPNRGNKKNVRLF